MEKLRAVIQKRGDEAMSFSPRSHYKSSGVCVGLGGCVRQFSLLISINRFFPWCINTEFDSATLSWVWLFFSKAACSLCSSRGGVVCYSAEQKPENLWMELGNWVIYLTMVRSERGVLKSTCKLTEFRTHLPEMHSSFTLHTFTVVVMGFWRKLRHLTNLSTHLGSSSNLHKQPNVNNPISGEVDKRGRLLGPGPSGWAWPSDL